MADKEGTIHLDRYTTDAKQLVAGAQQIADEKQHTEVTPLHLLMRLLERDRGVCEVFRRAGADPSEVSTLTEAALRKQPRASGGVAYVSPRLLDLLARAEREATRDKSETVGVEHLLHAIAQEIKGPAGEILSSFGIGPGAFRPHLGALSEAAREPASSISTSNGDGGTPGSLPYTRDLVADAEPWRWRLSLADIEKQIADFGKRAQEGKLTVDELTGGTYTISNGGTFGSMMSTPIINPPQSAILGMHATKERAVVENGQIVARPMMYLAQSYDHRIIDGRESVGFLVRVKELLENPDFMLFGHDPVKTLLEL